MTQLIGYHNKKRAKHNHGTAQCQFKASKNTVDRHLSIHRVAARRMAGKLQPTKRTGSMSGMFPVHFVTDAPGCSHNQLSNPYSASCAQNIENRISDHGLYERYHHAGASGQYKCETPGARQKPKPARGEYSPNYSSHQTGAEWRTKNERYSKKQG
jgi:hypothetical protein